MTSTVDLQRRGAGANPPRPAATLPRNMKVTQLRVLRSEWLKFWSLRSSVIAVAATVIGMVGFGALFAGVTAAKWSVMPADARAHFDAAGVSLRGYFLAQLIVGVLGVLVISGEYGTGMIRASLSAAPKRLPVLWAKLIVFATVTFVVSTVASFAAFFVGQALLSSQHLNTTLGAPGVFRVVIGTSLYLTMVGLIGVAIGWIVRSTAGSIATLFGLLLVLPALGEALPDSWGQHINPYLPSNAGQSVLALHPDPGSLAPWTGFGVFVLYGVVATAIAAILLKRRDA